MNKNLRRQLKVVWGKNRQAISDLSSALLSELYALIIFSAVKCDLTIVWLLFGATYRWTAVFTSDDFDVIDCPASVGC